MTEDQEKAFIYLPKDHKAHAEMIRRVYPGSHRELAIPFPATPLLRFPKINQLTGGLRPYEFTILCGGTGTGKTTLCANISRTLLEQQIKHFVLSVETGHTDYVKRIMSAMVGRDWNTGDAVPVEDLKKFHVEHGGLFENDNLLLSLYDDRVPVETLLADLAYARVKEHCKVAIIDNLNFFMEVTRASDAIVEMDRVIHELVIFAKKVDMHIIMVMHPRKNETGRVESEFDIKGSSTAVQEAHNILLFNRPHPSLIKQGFATEDDRELMICKMRRKGKYVRKRLILRSSDGVSYQEGDVV